MPVADAEVCDRVLRKAVKAIAEADRVRPRRTLLNYFRGNGILAAHGLLRCGRIELASLIAASAALGLVRESA